MEEQNMQHLQLMTFMNEFRTSMENKITKTNEKLDEQMSDLRDDMKELKTKTDATKTDTNEILRRLDNRLGALERKMNRRTNDELHGRLTNGRKIDAANGMESQKVKPKKKFHRRTISKEDLIDTVASEAAAETTDAPTDNDNDISPIKSSWASRMEDELANAAQKSERQSAAR